MTSIIASIIFSAVLSGTTVFLFLEIYHLRIERKKWVLITAAISSLSASIMTYLNENNILYIIGFFFILLILVIFSAKVWDIIKSCFNLLNSITKGKITLFQATTHVLITLLGIAITYSTNYLDNSITFGLCAGFFIIIGFLIWRQKTPKKQFFKLQQMLPTSKIGSMAMGLVEVQGTAIAEKQKLRTAPLSKRRCIAYHYTVHQETKNSEGKKYYKTITDQTQCAPFKIQDETGSASVITDDLSLISLPPTCKYEKGNMRYVERAIFNHDTIMLIGAAAEKANQIVIQKDIENDILAAAPIKSVKHWNKHYPLKKSALTFIMIAVFLSAIVLTIPYEYNGQALTLMFNKSPLFSWLF
ncbi:hypothetical protein WDV76_00045 [Xenorhabdus griffiniae]|uniref:hypothetical protein n=1 Tax=Xenorhabdus griffiniae TaxID=351672 RepID=UPI0030D48673